MAATPSARAVERCGKPRSMGKKKKDFWGKEIQVKRRKMGAFKKAPVVMVGICRRSGRRVGQQQRGRQEVGGSSV